MNNYLEQQTRDFYLEFKNRCLQNQSEGYDQHAEIVSLRDVDDVLLCKIFIIEDGVFAWPDRSDNAPIGCSEICVDWGRSLKEFANTLELWEGLPIEFFDFIKSNF